MITDGGQRSLYIVRSNPVPGREAEYDDWCPHAEQRPIMPLAPKACSIQANGANSTRAHPVRHGAWD
jgi:hypothetical protein